MPAVWSQLDDVRNLMEKLVTQEKGEPRTFDESMFQAITFQGNHIRIWVDGTMYLLTITRPRVQWSPPMKVRR